jgi:tripartite-type tricarboxylate transporter receptor subunit TctC
MRKLQWLWFLLAMLGLPAAAQYPFKPVRPVVPAAAGGPTDLIARAIAPKLSEGLGQPVLVDNRGGAGGVVGTDIVAKAAPDGHTLALVFISHATNPAMAGKLPYDSARDFAPVTLVGYQTLLLVTHPSLPVNSVRDLITLAKSKPGKLDYAADKASGPHLAGELFKASTGTAIVHIAYKGNGPALADTLSGQIPFMFNTISTSLPHVKAGKLKALAVTSAQRSPLAPDVPTMAESGLPGFEVTPWYGILAPAGTPPEVVARLNAEALKVLRNPETRALLERQGIELVGSSPQEFGAYLQAETAKWTKVIKSAGIHGD